MSSSTPGNRGRLLVIDDDVDIRRTVSDRLEAEGYEVLPTKADLADCARELYDSFGQTARASAYVTAEEGLEDGPVQARGKAQAGPRAGPSTKAKEK